MVQRWIKPRDLWSVAGWACIGVATFPFGGAMLWALIAPLYLLVLAAKLVTKLIPSKRDQVSLRGMWLGPALFLVLLPLYVHRLNAAREAGDQLVKAVEHYHQLHGAYPDHEEDLDIDASLKMDHFLFYVGVEGKPHVGYASPLIMFDTYSYDFDRKEWLYLQD